MGTAWVECWKCDKCGHRWIKGETWPSHCASSKCRKRSWNKTGDSSNARSQSPQRDRMLERTLDAVPVMQVRPQLGDGRPATPTTPPKMNGKMEVFLAQLKPAAQGPEEECPMCAYTEWFNGELYTCGLREHSPKIKHTRGALLS